jgi:prepilin-type N-terminal cleavage/methylation domain
MISKINRLRAKKGFTMIEMIVVVAIIGILTTIVVASMSYDRKPTMGKGLAKDLYYVAQDAASSVEVANPKAFDGYSPARAGFYAKVDVGGNVTEIRSMSIGAFDGSKRPDISYSTPLDPDSPKAVKHDGTADDDHNAFENKLASAISDYLSTKDSMEGGYYVMFDSNYRVMVAYWSDSDKMYLGAGSLTDECIMDTGYYCCAYPTKYCMPGQFMFGVN